MNSKEERSKGERLVDTLLGFVERVASGKISSEKETEILPEIAELLADMI